MLGNPIFGTLLSQVPGHSVSSGVNMNQASNNVGNLSNNATMLPGGLTVSVLQPAQQLQQPQSAHTQQIPLVSQHIQPQTIQGQSQQHQIQQQQQNVIQQPTQIIQAHQLTTQQQQFLLQSPSSHLQGQINPLQNFVIVGASPTMFVTSGGSGGNFLTPSAPGGNFFVTSGHPGLNVVGGLGGLVQTLTANGQQVGTSVIATNNSISDPSIDDTINQVVSSFTNTTTTPSGANTSIALGNDSFALSTTNNSQTSTPSRSVGGGGPFQCNMCERSYKYRHGLTQHIQQIHMGRRPFPCVECGKGFTRRAQLEKHMRLHSSGSDTFTCAICEEVFHMRESYILHLRTHGGTDTASYNCEVCNEEFQDNALLADHYSKEHPDFKPPADVIQGVNGSQPNANGAECTGDNGTNGRPILDMAVLASNSAKIIARRRKRAARRLLLASQQLQANPNGRGGGHLCNICGKRFLNHYGLKRHVRTHTGERPHECDICGLSFMERSHMKQHRMTHTGETPYQCQYCHRGFNRKFSHERHIRWHTKGGLTYAGDGNARTAAPSSMSEFLDTVVNEIVNGGILTDSSPVSKSDLSTSLPIIKQESYVQQTSPHQSQQQTHLSQNIYLNDITSNGNVLPLGASFTMHLNSLNALPNVNQQPSHQQQHNVLYATTDVSSSSMNTLLLTGNGNSNCTDGNTAASFIHNAVVSESSNGHPMLSFTIPAASLGGSFNLISGGNAVPIMTAVAIPSGSVNVNGNAGNANANVVPNGGVSKHD